VTILLQTQNLCCERDHRVLVDHLNLTVSSGQICQVEGPNGSGKTTLLRVLCGLSSRYQGEILWKQQPVGRVTGQFRSELLYLGHTPGTKAVLTPRENLQWYVANRGFDNAEIEPALAKVGLYGYEDTPCYSLSAGQQRRVALARLFVGECPLWILDEPFTAIDKIGVAELEQWIAEHARQGGSVMLTTHHELNIDHDIRKVILGGMS
jgi:heme exporter protein A